MKMEDTSVVPFLILCVATMLFLSLYSSPSNLECEILLQSSSTLVFMVFVFNIMIFAFVVKGHTPSYDGIDWSLPSLFPVDGIEEEREEETCSDENDNDYCHYPYSDGYIEEDDDNGSDSEVGWEDEEEQDIDDLNRRIEEFIAKVNTGWREERLRENLHPRFPFLPGVHEV